jgi:homoserine O-succinyltransferase/O-acetyltransferase
LRVLQRSQPRAPATNPKRMPVKIPSTLPARATLEAENIFVMSEDRALGQEIRPVRLAILNLMPTKISTETQLLRLLGNTPLQVEVTLLHTLTHESRHTDKEHMTEHYVGLDRIMDLRFDGLIITGAPVEQLEFEEVNYWRELCEIMDWAKEHVASTLYICWGAQAGLFHHFRVPKHGLPSKMFGVFEHKVLLPNERLLRGFDDLFFAPHSRHTETRRADLEQVPELQILCESAEAGVHIAATKNGRHIFFTGHFEYDPLTLKSEYERDVAKGLPIRIPCNYFPNDDPSLSPVVRWRAHANLVFSNWLNYYVYQVTSFPGGR